MQMEFANLTGTPFYQPSSLMRIEGLTKVGISFKTREIDTSRRIRLISMKVMKTRPGITGLRFIDDEGGYVLDLDFSAEAKSKLAADDPLTDKTKIQEKTWRELRDKEELLENFEKLSDYTAKEIRVLRQLIDMQKA